MRKEVVVIGAILVALVFSSCASVPHRISDEELSPEWSGKAYRNLLVIGVYTDRPYRIGAETSFAEILKGKGITATPSYDLIPQLSSLESQEDLAEKLATTDHDAVLVVATLDEGYDYDIGDYFATRGMVYLLGGRPGTFTNLGSFIAWAGSGHYTLYVGLWDAKAQKPVWQITTNSETTGSESEDAKALADFVVEKLREKGLL